ncbi:MAG TPA: SpoIIE family protein phosphatase [Rhodothermales bacterium]|nr:SpoIIE family protein phosphatase [Rhodothermales bacterium]
MPTRLLVVDDEPDLELLIRQKFRRRVRSGEIDFVFAGDGIEALAALEANPDIAVVLTDINMPRMDGLTLLDRIGDLDRLIKVVIVSAYGDMSNIRTAMNRGAFDFIIKPIDFVDLETTVDKTIREVEALQEATVLRTQLDSLQHELDLARQIQLSSLPSRFPAFPDRSDFDLHATMLPAREVGGDFYDFFLVDDDRLGFVLGDVSGKGMGAALFMAVTRTMVRATALRGLPVETCVRHVNRVLHPESLPRMFVTLIYGLLDTRTGAVTYCNAGHNLPYVVRASGEVALVPRTGGIGLCLASDFDYQPGTITLQPGDSLLLYTDGVTEAVDEHNEQFEEERLATCLHASNGEAAEPMIRHVLHTVEVFADGTAQADDLTLLALRYRGRA